MPIPRRFKNPRPSSSLVFCRQAGSRHPPPPLLSSLSSSLHFLKTAFHKIIYHSYSWSTFWSLPQNSSLPHIPQQRCFPLTHTLSSSFFLLLLFSLASLLSHH